MRTLIALGTALLLLSGVAFASGEDGTHPRTYRVRQTAKLDQIPAGAKLVRWWVAVPDDAPHQQVLDFAVTSAPGAWRLERDADRGNKFLYIEVPNPDASALSAVVEFTLRREPVHFAVDPATVGPITEAHRSSYAEELRRDAPHMVVTPEIQRRADEVCGAETNPAIQATRLLEHVAATADHYSKDPTKPNCGVGDAEACIANGGGCCTDLHSLFIALARARGIPARLQMGYRLQAKNEGREVDPGYRCWVEYYLPGHGWVPADIVEADAPGGLGPKQWFTGLTERRVWLNQGREFRLEPRQSGGPVNTMSIGYAEIDGAAARVLPEGELKPQLTRSVGFQELNPGESANLNVLSAPAGAAPVQPKDPILQGTQAGATGQGGAQGDLSAPTGAGGQVDPAGTGATHAGPQGPSMPPWGADVQSIFSRLSFYSDGRLRGESTFDDDPTGDDRHRGRMRFRVGGMFDLTESVRMEGRISTASANSDSNNPHWDFGDGADGFNGADLVLDRFFLKWVPECVPGERLDVRAGKLPHMFTSPPVFGELMWDADISPSGLGAIWSQPAEGNLPAFDVRAVEYIAVENGTDSDPSMFGLQANATLPIADRTSLHVATSYSHWSSLGSGVGVLQNQGNTDVAGDFKILEAYGAATYDGGPLGRSTGFLQVMVNGGDDDDEEGGVALGVQFGKSGKRGDLNFFGVLYNLEANAVFSPVAQDDTPIEGTGVGDGMHGVILGGQYWVSDNLALKLWFLTSDADATEDPFRVRLDIDFKVK